MNRFYRVILKNLPRITAYFPRMKRMALLPQRYSREQRWDLAMRCVRHVARTGKIEVEAYGLENIPEEDGCLFCANHQDKFDALAIWLTHDRPVSAVISDAACHRPLIRDFVRMIDAVRLKGDNLRSMYRMSEEITRRLREGERFIIFPEGRYERSDHALLPFKPGSFRSAILAERPIVPVAIVDSFQAFAEDTHRAVRVGVHYLEPLLPGEFAGLRTNEVAELVRGRIQVALDEFQS